MKIAKEDIQGPSGRWTEMAIPADSFTESGTMSSVGSALVDASNALISQGGEPPSVGIISSLTRDSTGSDRDNTPPEGRGLRLLPKSMQDHKRRSSWKY